jgi:hypothetical protein
MHEGRTEIETTTIDELPEYGPREKQSTMLPFVASPMAQACHSQVADSSAIAQQHPRDDRDSCLEQEKP